MKRFLSIFLTALLVLSLTLSPAFAAVSAIPNQKLSFRTGPGTKYVEWYTVPQSTEIIAFEYESSSVTWVLVELMYNGERVRAYTGLKRMTVNGDIPWADHLYQPIQTICAADVYAAPTADAAYRDSLDYMQTVSLLRWDGSYAFVEYTTPSGALNRGWVPAWAFNTHSQPSYESNGIVTGGVSIPMYVDLTAPIYDAPAYSSTASMAIPQYAQVQCYGELYCGFSIVEYAGYVGYVPTHFLNSY